MVPSKCERSLPILRFHPLAPSRTLCLPAALSCAHCLPSSFSLLSEGHIAAEARRSRGRNRRKPCGGPRDHRGGEGRHTDRHHRKSDRTADTPSRRRWSSAPGAPAFFLAPSNGFRHPRKLNSPGSTENCRICTARLPPQPRTCSKLQPNAEAADIDSVGHGVAERLNQIAKNLHGKINLPPNEPVAELILADYMENYGPEIWQLTFTLQQAMQREDYYDTHVPLPQYRQFWPPEKGQPRTLRRIPLSTGRCSALADRSDSKEGSGASKNFVLRTRKCAKCGTVCCRVKVTKYLPWMRFSFYAPRSTSSRRPIARNVRLHRRQKQAFSWIFKPPAEPEEAQPRKKSVPPDAPSLLQPHFRISGREFDDET